MISDSTRRNLLLAAGTGLVATAGLPQRAHATTLSGAEKANVKLVREFLKGWSKSDFDPDKEFPLFLASDASVRMIEDKPPIIGAVAAGAASKQMVPPGTLIQVDIHNVYAHGPVVVTDRTDTIKISGKPDQRFKVAGVFIVKKGKITEWTDYLA